MNTNVRTKFQNNKVHNISQVYLIYPFGYYERKLLKNKENLENTQSKPTALKVRWNEMRLVG